MATTYLRRRELIRRGIVPSTTTLYRWMDELGFPRPVYLGPRTPAWEEAEVYAWAESRRTARPAGGAAA